MDLRRLYLLNSNYADLSFMFTILPGEKSNAHLGSEYLAALETDNSAPYFLNPHNGEVAHTLILGMAGSGKSYFCNFLLQNTQKYAPLTFICTKWIILVCSITYRSANKPKRTVESQQQSFRWSRVSCFPFIHASFSVTPFLASPGFSHHDRHLARNRVIANPGNYRAEPAFIYSLTDAR